MAITATSLPRTLTGMPTIFSIGHGTATAEDFIRALTDAGVRLVADIRSAPGSRRNPQFGASALRDTLAAAGIEYVHLPGLGGRRAPRPDSPHTGLRVAAFRGYADHMASEEFHGALTRLQARGREHATCMMCAEAQWWRCHRRLIADALVIRGWRVLHLGLHATAVEHELTPFAVLGEDHTLTYPPLQTELEMERGPRPD